MKLNIAYEDDNTMMPSKRYISVIKNAVVCKQIK